jgi:acetyltransferase-like isoleucine patch superfamily enzyme
LLFDKKYLRGRYFDASLVGWTWVLRSLLFQKILGFNRHVPWPVSPFIAIDDPRNLEFDVDDLNNFQTFGCYFSNSGGGKIVIGSGTWIAPNVGIITTNHSLDDISKLGEPSTVSIGKHCWLGMNSVILPRVRLGDHCIVGAGSIVTKSYPEGYCVLAGSPAQVIKRLDLVSEKDR